MSEDHDREPPWIFSHEAVELFLYRCECGKQEQE